MAKNSSLTSGSIVQIPKVYHYDQTHHVLILQDCGDLPTLESVLLNTPPSIEVSAQIGHALGEFLAKLHVWGRENEYMKKTFENYITPVTISLFTSYGKSDATEKELVLTNAEKLVLNEIVTSVIESMQQRETFTMGEFWRGNILVDIDPDTTMLRQIYIIDWEMARYGLPSHDVAQFIPDFVMPPRFKYHLSSNALLSSFLLTYKKLCHLDNQDIKTVATHVGMHIFVWANGFALKYGEDKKQFVAIGTEYMMKAWAQDWSWLERSVIKDLF
ncbi:unnamed protein product [Didymodactylos carnosus]|uniref:Aminoglycoside phosphotransferase domain-containing protein n=1 Tax=Didymodactylos carnosus TaxID=1234261 RepID=A0A815FZ89_9BILA|nr:unnamed protein product [Didymodactylos carnosus]CAF4185913.1 unnamed protein product [Didymodactylos carnosus]